MEKIVQMLSKRVLLLLLVLFIISGWGLLLYQEERGTLLTVERGNYVRLHILANSDSIEDQQVKLKVRDAVVAYLTPYVKNAVDAQEAKTIMIERQGEIMLVAKKCLADNGINYPVNIQIGNFDFPVRTYGSLMLPAGEYQAVRILLGEGAGQNWWCVLFPPLCFIDGTNAVSAPAAPASENIQPESDGRTLKVRWKLAELFN